MSDLLTKLSVTQIQRGIVRSLGGSRVEAVPNVSWGFFREKGIECDLLVLSGANNLHEYEIKRSWGDFLADFKKTNFHNDLRLKKLTFVLPLCLAGEKLKKWCADNYQTFKRTFDFWFYDEYAQMYRPNLFPVGSKYTTEYYLTEEMLWYINMHDPLNGLRRSLFLEERYQLCRLACIRLWSNPPAEALPNIPSEEYEPWRKRGNGDALPRLVK